MNKVKITVLKTTFDKELSEEYGVPGFTKCAAFTPGQTFITDFAKPDKFCDEAWKAIYQYVFALAHNADTFYGEGVWINKPGMAICSCNDGLRPVIFKIEALDKKA